MTGATPGAPLPEITVPLVDGGSRVVGGGRPWQLLIVYRGKHCPRCKTYLAKLGGLMDGFSSRGVEVTVTSADPEERAREDRDAHGWTLDLGHSLSLADMAALGLYVSDPRSPQETDRPFAEPGLFLTNGEGVLQVISVSNAASCRPDLVEVLDGVAGIQDRGIPVRGLRGITA